ncbi:MAG: ABC transporter ATP-binding protein [Dehalococcoidia bacterium]|nr:ABC transporter ATP-binding protein [Dehalococcoidia bacterium]
MPHISATDLTKSFGTLQAISNLHLSIEEGEFVSIIGPSGCGKSTLLRILGGMLVPSSGSVAIGGGSPQAAQSRKQIGFVFQDPALLPWRNVTSNINLPMEINRGAPSGVGVSELLDMVGLKEFESFHPYQLSGGMQQRVALARALVFDPSVLLMDEPFGALDEITRGEMRYELLRIWEQRRKTVLFVTHSIAEAIALSDRVLVMSRQPGQIKADIAINLPRPRMEDIELTDKFRAYAKDLKDLLK